MKVVAKPFAVDLDKVKAVFGCKNQELFENIMKTKTFKQYNQKVRFRKELHNIIFKYVEESSSKSAKLFGFIRLRKRKNLKGKWIKYGFALHSICDYLGKDLSFHSDTFCYNEQWWKLNTILRKQGSKVDLSKMINPSRLFDTPFEKEKICNNYYSKEEIKHFSEHIRQIQSMVDHETFHLYETVKTALDYCIDKDCEWVSFSYQSENYNPN